MVQEKRVNPLVITRNSCTFALVDGQVTNKAVTNGGLCDRKYVLYIDTANIRLFSHTSKFQTNYLSNKHEKSCKNNKTGHIGHQTREI